MMGISYTIICAGFDRMADLIENNGLSIPDALRKVSQELQDIQTEDWGKPVPFNIVEARDRFMEFENADKREA